MCPAVRQQSFTELDTQIAVVGCINQHQCLYSVPATEQQETVVVFHILRQHGGCGSVSLCVFANRFTSDCFSNEVQYKAALPRH